MRMNHSFSRFVAIGSLMLAVGACATAKKEEPAPAAEPAAAAPAQAPQSKALTNDTYEVKRGDHLWGIASQPRIYGNPYAWPLIYKANSGKIQDADLIHPGQSLDINRNASSSDMDAAVRHAKTRGAWKLGVTEQSDKNYLAGKL
jgi:nucleoid-associated protein YgaU